MGKSKRRARLVRERPVRASAHDQHSRERTVAAIAAQAASLKSVYEAEYCMSSLLGQLWERRQWAPPLDGLDCEMIVGAPLAEDLARHGGLGARIALHTLGRLVPSGFGALCAQRAQAMTEPLPAWTRQVGRSRVIGASAAESPGDGEAILLEVRGVGMIDHAVAVFIDERLDGIAKQVGLIYPQSERVPDIGEEFPTDPVDPRDACERVLDAIMLTDAWPQAPVDERFATLRAIAVARVHSLLRPRLVVPWLN